MMLTAAKFYGSPTTPNARLLFRASLFHLPLFMAAFLLHRLPNTNDDKAGLLMLNARRLGIGQPLTAEERWQGLHGDGSGDISREQQEEEDSLAQQALAALSRVRLNFPPSPFVPMLPLSARLTCPSKASCEQAAKEADDAEGQQQQQQQAAARSGAEQKPPSSQS
jgi:protoheme IX farnesyltransferase